MDDPPVLKEAFMASRPNTALSTGMPSSFPSRFPSKRLPGSAPDPRRRAPTHNFLKIAKLRGGVPAIEGVIRPVSGEGLEILLRNNKKEELLYATENQAWLQLRFPRLDAADL